MARQVQLTAHYLAVFNEVLQLNELDLCLSTDSWTRFENGSGAC